MEPTEKSSGAFAGLIIIIIILIIGGVYLWKNNAKEVVPESGLSAGASNIDAELNSVDLEGLDSEI